MNYPVFLFNFLQGLMNLAALDVYFGEEIVEFLFKFSYTVMFSQHFEDFQISDMNFLAVSGSIFFPLLIVAFIKQIVFFSIFSLAKKVYTLSGCRKVAMTTEPLQTGFLTQMFTFLHEGFFELVLCTVL